MNILALDIGGTNARLAHFYLDNHKLELKNKLWLKSSDLKNSYELFSEKNFQELKIAANEIDICVGALACPITDKARHELSNSDLVFDTDIAKECGLKKIVLVNDFLAHAYACLSDIADKSELILGQKKHEKAGVIGVLGAGTGFGAASLFKHNNSYLALASEFGHTDIAFYNDEEKDFGEFLCKKLNAPFAIYDTVVSGVGLSLLHEFLYDEVLLPHEILLDKNQKTIEFFARFYARACKNFVLTTLCEELYISGGIAAKNPHIVQHEEFKKEFFNSVVHQNILRNTAISLNSQEDSGLYGAAYYAYLLVQ